MTYFAINMLNIWTFKHWTFWLLGQTKTLCLPKLQKWLTHCPDLGCYLHSAKWKTNKRTIREVIQKNQRIDLSRPPHNFRHLNSIISVEYNFANFFDLIILVLDLKKPSKKLHFYLVLNIFKCKVQNNDILLISSFSIRPR